MGCRDGMNGWDAWDELDGWDEWMNGILSL